MARPIPVYLVPAPTNWLGWLLLIAGGLWLIGQVITFALIAAMWIGGIGAALLLLIKWPRQTLGMLFIAGSLYLAAGRPYLLPILLVVYGIIAVFFSRKRTRAIPDDPKLLSAPDA